MMVEFLGRPVARRVALQADQVSRDADGVRKLAEARSWRALMQLSQQLLADRPKEFPSSATAAAAPAAANDPATTPGRDNESAIRLSHLEISAFRVAALLQLRNFRGAHEELSRLGSLDDVSLWTGQDANAPLGIALRVLEAEVRNAMGQRRQAIDSLYLLLNSVRTILSSSKDVDMDEGDQEGGGGGGDDAPTADDACFGKDTRTQDAGQDAGLALLRLQGPRRLVVQQQQRIIISVLVAQHIEGGDYASARALLEPPAAGEGTPQEAAATWDSAFGWALVRLHVHFGSLPAAEQALAVCEQRDPVAAKGACCLWLPNPYTLNPTQTPKPEPRNPNP